MSKPKPKSNKNQEVPKFFATGECKVIFKDNTTLHCVLANANDLFNEKYMIEYRDLQDGEDEPIKFFALDSTKQVVLAKVRNPEHPDNQEPETEEPEVEEEAENRED